MTRKLGAGSDGPPPTDDYIPIIEPPLPPVLVPLPPSSKPAPKKPATTQKTSTLGDYRLVAILGQGAMGTVYRARQISTSREAAIKVLRKELALRGDFAKRFLREAKLMARLNHPNVLRCFTAGESHGYQYLAMEFASGGSVQSWLEKLTRFELSDAICIVTGAARGLGYAHENKLVHRDVKPDNLLFSSAGIVKVADLGLARQTDDSLNLTQTGAIIGTPLYAAPEQVRDAKRADGRSDIYALGGVLYHLLAGRLPFEASNFVRMILAKDRGTFAPLRQSQPALPERVDRIVSRMLATEPEDRYPNCSELLADLALLGTPPEVPSFFRKGTTD